MTPRHDSITDEFIAWLWRQVEASTSDALDEPEEIWEAVNQVEEGKTRAEIMRDLVTYRLIGGKGVQPLKNHLACNSTAHQITTSTRRSSPVA
jgi:hypothetical protein